MTTYPGQTFGVAPGYTQQPTVGADMNYQYPVQAQGYSVQHYPAHPAPPTTDVKQTQNEGHLEPFAPPPSYTDVMDTHIKMT